MSAIFGIWNKTNQKPGQHDMETMQKLLINYGKDNQGIHQGACFFLGVNLRTIAKGSFGELPIIQSADRSIVLGADAFLYNREELIMELKAENQEISNNKLLLLAYQRWGTDFVKHLNGDFVIAVYENEKLMLFRDHLGVRPLYYYEDSRYIVFATDYKAILGLSFVSPEIEAQKLYELLVNPYRNGKELSYFKNIKKCLPAHRMEIVEGSIYWHKYWSPDHKGKIRFSTEQEYAKELFELVQDAVNIRVSAFSGKIGAELSGGLDSSVVDALAQRKLKQNGRSIDFVLTWSPGYDRILPQEEEDERLYMEKLCQMYDLPCEYTDLNVVVEYLDQKQEDLIPIETNQLKAMYYGMRLEQEKNINVMLSGWGGDQAASHGSSIYELVLNKEFSYALKIAKLTSGGRFKTFIKKLIRHFLVLPIQFKSGTIYDKVDNVNIYNQSFLKNCGKRPKMPVRYQLRKRAECGELQSRTDYAAEAGAEHDVYYIFPLLDYRIYEFACNIPMALFVKDGKQRYLFRKAFEDILPPGLFQDRSKDDAARFKYMMQPDRIKKGALNIMNHRLDRELFQKYLDYDEISRYLKQDDCGILLRTRQKLEILYNIQKILKHYSDKDGNQE